LREAGLPEPQNVLRQTEIAGDFADGPERFGRFHRTSGNRLSGNSHHPAPPLLTLSFMMWDGRKTNRPTKTGTHSTNSMEAALFVTTKSENASHRIHLIYAGSLREDKIRLRIEIQP
jgi:hypothetical protein